MAERYPQRGFTPPPGSMMLTLVRHGQSQAGDPENPFPLVDGHGDPPLTELGHQQGQAVGNRLQHEHFDALYVSSLTRTHQTAAPLVAATGLEMRIEPDIREVFLGDWEGGLFRKMLHEGTHPAILEMRRTGDWGAVPGAETNEEFSTRCRDAITRIASEHADQNVVAFVHGGVIAALVSKATGGQLMGSGGADNGSIHRLCIAESGWSLRGFNDVNHLSNVSTPA